MGKLVMLVDLMLEMSMLIRESKTKSGSLSTVVGDL